MRPQNTKFADSARHRDSIHSLGTIAHLQYYFARTGLLDGKGAQLARDRKSSQHSGSEKMGAPEGDGVTDGSRDAALAFLTGEREPSIATDDQSDFGLSASPEDTEPMMLPPTVSTFKYKPTYVPPPPDMMVLRRELVEALENARKVMQETEADSRSPQDTPRQIQTPPRRVNSAPLASPFPASDSSPTNGHQQPQGWYEIQGLHLLDIVTLAIRAAKNYYTAHERPKRLYSIKPERQIRSELFQVLEVLKRIAARNFSGGPRPAESEQIVGWIDSISALLRVEEEKEKAEDEQRERWQWRESCDASGRPWTDRQRERELLFFNSFADYTREDIDPETKQKLEPLEPLPEWTDPAEASQLPTPFLERLGSGLQLVRLHNALVRESCRPFEDIRVFHTDLGKPYRRAENLRYWAKAAELRWDAKLHFDALAIANKTDDQSKWLQFDEALLSWAKKVREELTAEWIQMKESAKSKPPTLVFDTEHSANES